MRRFLCFGLLFAVCASTLPAAADLGKSFDGQLSSLEKELVPLAEAMPADKYGFAPKEGAFEGARTFQQQMSHIATVLYMVGASMQGEKMPVAAGTNENGDAAVLASKDATVKYLKDSFAYCHKALQKFTSADQSGPSPFGGKTPMPYAGMASIMLWHSFDHYGQSVVYLRMNGIIPPASRK